MPLNTCPRAARVAVGACPGFALTRVAAATTLRARRRYCLPFVHVSVNERNKALMKRRWIEAGRPRYPDWRAMMSDLIGGEAAFDEAMADVRRQQEERLRQSQTAAQQAS